MAQNLRVMANRDPRGIHEISLLSSDAANRRPETPIARRLKSFDQKPRKPERVYDAFRKQGGRSRETPAPRDSITGHHSTAKPRDNLCYTDHHVLR